MTQKDIEAIYLCMHILTKHAAYIQPQYLYGTRYKYIILTRIFLPWQSYHQHTYVYIYIYIYIYINIHTHTHIHTYRHNICTAHDTSYSRGYFYLDGLIISTRDEERFVTACEVVQAIDTFLVAFQGEVRLRRRETPDLYSIHFSICYKTLCSTHFSICCKTMYSTHFLRVL